MTNQPDLTAQEVRVPRRGGHLETLLALLLGSAVAPPPKEENTPHHPHHTPAKPPRQPKPLPAFEPSPMWKDAPTKEAQRLERVAFETAHMAECEGHGILAANDVALAQDAQGGVWFLDTRPAKIGDGKTGDSAERAHDLRRIVGKLAPAPGHRVRVRLAPHITTRQRRAVVRWLEGQEQAALVLREVGFSGQRFEMGAGLPSFEAERVGSLALVLGRPAYEALAALPRYVVRFRAEVPARAVDFDGLYARFELGDEVSAQFVGYGDELGDPTFRRSSEADADVWSPYELERLRDLVGLAFDADLHIVIMTPEVDHARA